MRWAWLGCVAVKMSMDTKHSLNQCRVHGTSLHFVTLGRMMEGYGCNITTGPDILLRKSPREVSHSFSERSLFHPVPDPENYIHGYRLQRVDIGRCAV